MKGKTGILKLSAAMLIFGSIGIFVRYISLPSGAVAAARGVIGTLFLAVLAAVRRQKLSSAIRQKLPLLHNQRQNSPDKAKMVKHSFNPFNYCCYLCYNL